MQHDIEQARHFLTLLDETEDQFTFQTFDDDKKRIKQRQEYNKSIGKKDSDPLAKWLHGTIDQHWKTLCDLNKKRAGVFVMFNAGNGNGRNNNSVTRVRGVFNENDNGLPEGVQHPIEPNIIVETSPGKTHHYFLCDGIKVTEWEPIQDRMIADYGSDEAAKGLARVLRLPGFYHCKSKPFRVSIIHESGGQSYSKEALLKAFPPYVNGVKKDKVIDNIATCNVDEKLVIELRSALNHLSSENYQDWIDIGQALHGLGNVGMGLWFDWSSGYAAFDRNEAMAKWNGFNPDKIGYKSVFHKAQAAGWVNIAKNNKKTKEPIVSKLPIVNYEPKKNDKKKINIVDHIKDTHLLKRLSNLVAAETSLPINTVAFMGLAIYSAMTLRKYCVKYENGARLPIGLYAVAEHPPGTAKSWSLSTFQKPFYDIHADIPEIEEGTKPSLFITNATAEGLEVTLDTSRGFFSAASSEKGLFNALFGASYNADKANNNDISLNGFDGGYVNSKRVGRKGYEGQVCGAITCFAQTGSIESILKASDGTGLSERFLMLSEDHNLGKRDHTRKIYRDDDLLNEYAMACGFIDGPLRQPLSLRELDCLAISKDGFHLINTYRNKIEPSLADGGLYAASSLRGAAGKINMQIMKIAANLHLLDNGGLFFKSFIDDEHVESAIAIADDLLNANLEQCIDKGIFGFKAEYTAIINYLTGRVGVKSELDIINSLKNTNPFKTIEKNKNAEIRRVLHEMVEHGFLVAYEGDFKKIIYVLAK